MNGYGKSAALIGAIVLLCGFAACKETEIAVSFVQDGQETIVKKVRKGESLYDIPAPVQTKDGYTITWNRTDFSALKKSFTVKTVATPNVYVINYKTEENVRDCIGLQTVNYGEDFTLESPSLDGWIFVGWQLEGTETFVTDGKYVWTENITLTAVWDVDADDEYTYFY